VSATISSIHNDTVGFEDGAIVEMRYGDLICSCAKYDEPACEHIEQVLNEAADGQWVFEHIISNSDPTVLMVPLFKYYAERGTDPRYVYVPVSVKPMTTPIGQVGVCRFQVPAYPSIGSADGEFPGTLKAGGNAFASAGVIIQGEGRKAIATSISSWVAGQFALANARTGMTVVECDSYTHDNSAHLSPGDQTCIVITGQCVQCYINKPDITGDVPDF
jgi:hypothetical protein